MLCVCRHFNKKNSDTTDGSDEFCEKIGFKHRWELMFPGRVELGVGVGGLRALVFRSKVGDKGNVVFAFRDFQHEKKDYYIDDDALQELAYFGDDMWKRKDDNPAVQYLMGTLARNFLFWFRHLLGFDYHKHASIFVDEVLSRGNVKRVPIFTGFGFGGSIAVMQALRLDGASGVVFEAHGVKEMNQFFYYRPVTKRITNLILDVNETKLLGEPATVQCVFKTNSLASILEDQHPIYSWSGFIALDGARRECYDPVE